MGGKYRDFIDFSDSLSRISSDEQSDVDGPFDKVLLQTALSKTQVVCTTVGDRRIFNDVFRKKRKIKKKQSGG